MSINPVAPRLQVSTTNRQITAHAGAILVRETAAAVGLSTAVDQNLHLKKRRRGLSESQAVSGMAEAVAMGAECLDDLAVAGTDQVQLKLRGHQVINPRTAGVFLRRFTLGHIRQFDRALQAVHRRAIDLLEPVETLTLDFDSSYVKSFSSRRQGADQTYLKRYALHPLFCFVSGLDICLNAKLRKGSSHTARGIDQFIDQSLNRTPAGVRLRARFDSGFYSERLLAHLQKRGVTFLCGVPLNARIKEQVALVGEESWQPCLDKDEGEVAEFGYRMASSKIFRRYIVKRIERRPGEQLDLETGSYNYWVCVTNEHHADPPTLESEHRHKAQVEGGIRELKQNLGLHVWRKHGFYANWAWLLIVVTAHNLLRWTELLGQLGSDSRLRAKRLRYRYLNVAGLLVRSGRRTILKLSAHYPLANNFSRALLTIRALHVPSG